MEGQKELGHRGKERFPKKNGQKSESMGGKGVAGIQKNSEKKKKKGRDVSWAEEGDLGKVFARGDLWEGKSIRLTR